MVIVTIPGKIATKRGKYCKIHVMRGAGTVDVPTNKCPADIELGDLVGVATDTTTGAIMGVKKRR